jgi:putative resolvase
MNYDKQEKKFLTINEASYFSGIGSQTLRKMVDNKLVQSFLTPSGHRRINKESLQKLCNPMSDVKTPEISKDNFIYTRVSSKKQSDDLSRQIEYMSRPEYSNYHLIQDIGSGINFKRKGLQRILDSCLSGTIGEVIVAHKDRLSRFGFDLIELIITKAGGKITLLDNQCNKSTEQELAEDLLSIVNIFTCRQMGKRSYKKQTIVQNITSEN